MIALDLFAGTGWGVACQALGIDEHGVEIMPEAVATRTANGMRTIYNDVWEGLANDLIESRDGYGREAADEMRARGASFAEIYEILIASPPCQTFSMAGGGAGRKALDDVLGLIDAKAYRDVEALRAFGETHDPRTALVLTPLAHVYRDTTGGGTETGGAEPLAKLAREVAAADWVIRLDPSLPATTVQGDPRLTAREHHYHGEQNSTSTRVTVDEAAALQSYPPGFTFAGTKTKRFLQVGNAVPPLLAEAILRAVIS